MKSWVWTWLSLLLIAGTTAATTPLPTGFAGVEVGRAWIEVQDRHPFEDLATPTTDWGKFVTDCGYRSVLATIENGQLMVTVNDFVITDVSYTTAIEAGSDLFSVADLVIQNYGQPSAAIMRDLFGQVTIDKERVNFITLEYDRRDQIVFYISGRELWQYQIRVQLERYRWHENKTLRCAREKDAESSGGENTSVANPPTEDDATTDLSDQADN